jgi:hypothetical protein
MTTSKPKKRVPERLPCSRCHTDTLHDLLKEVFDVEDTEVFEGRKVVAIYSETTHHQMFQCRGCKSVVLRRLWRSDSGETETRYFPPPVARVKPHWFYQIPEGLQKLLSEIYRSLDADTRTLPLMGARAVLDMVIVETIGDVGSFEQKLKKLEAEGHISAKGRDILDAALDAGNAAAHRGYAPKAEHVHSIMDIVENLVHSTYVLAKVAKEIKQATPPRPPKKKVNNP